MSGQLLTELGYTEAGEPTSTRPSPKKDYPPPASPDFTGVSPDKYPSEEEATRDRSRSRSRSPSREQLEETQEELAVEQAKTVAVTQDLADLRIRFGRLRHRVIYLEGELNVYRRFAVIHSEPKPSPHLFKYPPPPPPPRRV